jgi:hypothetical protein
MQPARDSFRFATKANPMFTSEIPAELKAMFGDGLKGLRVVRFGPDGVEDFLQNMSEESKADKTKLH